MGFGRSFTSSCGKNAKLVTINTQASSLQFDPQNKMSSMEKQSKPSIEDDGVLLAMHLSTVSILPMVTKVAIELNVFETIAKAGPGARLSPKEIASHLSTQNPDAASMFDRILRLLASYSVLTSSTVIQENGLEERVYGLGPVSKYLVQNEDGYLAPYVVIAQDKVFTDSWHSLKDAIVEGGNAFHRAHGVHAFEYPETDPRYNRVYNQGMSNYTKLFWEKMLGIYKGFDGLEVVVDVAGGLGSTIGTITSKYPSLKGINFDLPHVVAQAPSYPGVDHIGGNMFDSVPTGDAIFMKWIIHDWTDESCLQILKNCYKALPENGKLIIVDAILPEKVESDTAAQWLYQLDLCMMALTTGGKERSEAEFRALIKGAGFARMNKVCCVHSSWIIECYKI